MNLFHGNKTRGLLFDTACVHEKIIAERPSIGSLTRLTILLICICFELIFLIHNCLKPKHFMEFFN